MKLPQKAPVWVADANLLKKVIRNLLDYDLLSVDTESNSLYAYQEQVCLIQFSTGEDDYLIDPLALDDLSPLTEIFVNPRIEKIFHAGEYDIICLKRTFDFTFTNIFDTMIASRILGYKKVGLANMVEKEFNVHLNKRFQRANWGKRPLSKEQMDYARLDTFYLVDLRNRLKSTLIASDRLQLAEEDFRRLCDTEIPRSSDPVESCWRSSGQYDLNPRQRTVLLELCRYRDQQARRLDVPPFKILGNQTLLQLAITMPTTEEEMQKNNKISARQVQRHGSNLLNAIHRGLKAPPVEPVNNKHRLDENVSNRLDALKIWRKNQGNKQGVESDVIMPRDVIEIIAFENPQTDIELKQLMVSVPWRYKHYGNQILDLLHQNYGYQ